MKNTHFRPANETEKILTVLPKECTCHICETSKKDAIQELGIKRFQEVCKLLKIVI